MKHRRLLWTAGLMMLPVLVYAQAPAPPVTIGTTFGQIQNAANGWIPAITQAASRLFYLLAAIDFAWSAPNFLRENDFMGLFLSLIKKLTVIAFFYWVLVQGQVWIPAIVTSFMTIGSNASGVPLQIDPSSIMAAGLQICSNLLSAVSGANLLMQPGASLMTLFMIMIVFASYLIITLHYVVTKLEAIIVMTAGYLFLGFAGSRWTMPYFERYIALAISTGTRLMLIYLMLGVFGPISQNWVNTMNNWDPSQPATAVFPTLAAMLLFAFASWMIPKMAGSIASGSLGLGAADLVHVGAAAATGAVAGATAATVGAAAIAAAPFTGGASLAAEGEVLAAEGAGLVEAAEVTVATASAAGESAGSAASAGAGPPVPLQEMTPPMADPSVTPTDGPPNPPAPAPQAQVAAPPAQVPPTKTASTSDAAKPSRQQLRQGNLRIPDDGSEHTPPAQLRVERED